jgi:hypothetical protein
VGPIPALKIGYSIPSKSQSLVRRILFPIFNLLFDELAFFIPLGAGILHLSREFGHALTAFHIKIMNMTESFFHILLAQHGQLAAAALGAGGFHFITLSGHADFPPLVGIVIVLID